MLNGQRLWSKCVGVCGYLSEATDVQSFIDEALLFMDNLRGIDKYSYIACPIMTAFQRSFLLVLLVIASCESHDSEITGIIIKP